MSSSKISIKNGGMDRFLGPSEFHQFMQQIGMGHQPAAERYLQPNWSYKVVEDNGDKTVELIKPQYKAHLREKLSQLRHGRMSRYTALKKMEKMEKKISKDSNGKSNDNANAMKSILNMHDSLKGKMPILHPTEAMADREKFRPVIEDLKTNYPENHPLTAYYNLLSRFLS